MKKAFVFPGQGAQFPGMAKDLYENCGKARDMMEEANEILGFRITDIMFNGSEDELKATEVTQPSIYIHSVVQALCNGPAFAPATSSEASGPAEHATRGTADGSCGTQKGNCGTADGSCGDAGNGRVFPDVVAGHSLGEFSALTAAGALSFREGLKLVSARARAMQKCCDSVPGRMAAIIGLQDSVVEELCKEASSMGIVVPANYNCDGQVVISGEADAVEAACILMKEAGARRALPLAVSGAFHSPLMEPARVELAKAIEAAAFKAPVCPIYQNVSASPETDPDTIRKNLLAQLTSSVRWSQTIRNMYADGIEEFVEIGPGTVLSGLIRKISKQ